MSAETLVAEAIAFAAATTDGERCPSRFAVIRTDLDHIPGPEWGGDVPACLAGGSSGPEVAYARADFLHAALRHLAERVEKAEAERATLVQALRRVRDEFTHARDRGSALYMLHKHTERALKAVGEDARKGSGAYAEKGAPRG